ncbi:MAG: PKD domain-containing protein, partial [Deltaproteobacteria bacterium]|nr:PKD domain-containing protein [Deltaproteobacteria bacterium]
QSVPEGNFWVRDLPAKLPTREREVATSLPEVMKIRVPWELPTRQGGYRFRLFSAPGSGDPLESFSSPRVDEIAIRGDQTTYWVGLTLPASSWPPRETTVRRMRLRAMAARDNTAPRPVIDMAVAGGLALQQVDDRFDVAPGEAVLLSAARSTDAEGDRIVSYLWDFGEGYGARGERVVHTFAGAGTHLLRLTLVDETGVQASVSRKLRVQAPLPRVGCGSCALGDRGESLASFSLVVFALGIAFAVGRRRRGRRG